MTLIDNISKFLGIVAAVMLFLTGVFLTYEVSARYLFMAPTTWASEVSELFLLWGVFLALGRTIHYCENISIDVIYQMLGGNGKRALDILVLVFVLVFFLVIAFYGYKLAWESFDKGSTTGTMVDIPNWWVEAAVPVGCAWAAIQTVVELIRVIAGHPWAAPAGHGGDL